MAKSNPECTKSCGQPFGLSLQLFIINKFLVLVKDEESA